VAGWPILQRSQINGLRRDSDNVQSSVATALEGAGEMWFRTGKI
jgi:hypothetical protein